MAMALNFERITTEGAIDDHENALVMAARLMAQMTHDERVAVAKEKGYVLWQKNFENKEKGCKIYQVKFKRFPYKNYRHKSLSIIENKQSLTFVSSTDKVVTYKVIFTFKNKRLAIYNIIGKKLIRVSPLKLQKYFLNGCLKDYSLKYKGLKKFEARLIKLFLTKCRANKIKVSKFLVIDDDFVKTVSRIYYPAYNNLIESAPNVQLLEDVSCIAPAFKQNTLKEAIKKLCGFDSKIITKLFIIAANNGSLNYKINILRISKGLIPIDYVQKILGMERVYHFGVQGSLFVEIRKFLKLFAPEVLLKWLENGEFCKYHLKDSVRMRKQILALKPSIKLEFPSNNIEEIHNYLVSVFNKLTNEDRDIKNPNELIASGVDGEKVGDYTLVLPKTSHELMDWGKKMRNCIGSYLSRIEQGYSWILGLKDISGEICYGIDIAPKEKRLIQLRGNCNVSAPQELEKLVVDVLTGKGLLLASETPNPILV